MNICKLLRRNAGYSGREFAKRLDITPGGLSLIESGQRQPSMRVARKAADILKVPLGVLLGHKDSVTEPFNAGREAGRAEAWREVLRDLETMARGEPLRAVTDKTRRKGRRQMARAFREVQRRMGRRATRNTHRRLWRLRQLREPMKEEMTFRLKLPRVGRLKPRLVMVKSKVSARTIQKVNHQKASQRSEQ
jgi:transcriptional regulator with XRE-family HTH domain